MIAALNKIVQEIIVQHGIIVTVRTHGHQEISMMGTL